MKYAQHRSNIPSKRSKRGGVLLKVVIVLVFLLVIFVAVKMIFRRNIEDVQVTEDVTEEVEVVVEPESKDTFEEIDISYSDSGGYAGFARRGVDDALFTNVVVGNFVELNTDTHFYEGWLVKPGVTEFFSTGEMFPREDGKWGLVWETDLDIARDDLMEFSKVVITLEQRDDDPAPSPNHIAEGEFEE